MTETDHTAKQLKSTALQIKLFYEDCAKTYGDSEGLRAFACRILDNEISTQGNFAAAAERRQTECERVQAEITSAGGDE